MLQTCTFTNFELVFAKVYSSNYFAVEIRKHGTDFCINIHYYPVDTGRKLNVHKTFKRRPGRLLNVLCTFNLRPVSTGYSLLLLILF